MSPFARKSFVPAAHVVAALALGGGSLLIAARAPAQEAPPPIAVPTDAVPQTPPPPPRTTPAPAAPQPLGPPAVAHPAASAAGGGSGGGGGGSSGGGASPAGPSAAAAPATSPGGGAAAGGAAEPAAPKYINEGVFRISGSGGSGWVGTGGKKSKGAAAPASGGGAGKPHAAHVAKDPGLVAEWPGFQMTSDGGSEVMIEFSKSPTAPSEHPSASTLEYVFSGARIKEANSKNPLLTMHFNTPVYSARLAQKGSDVHLMIDMRPGTSAAPATSMRAASDGSGQQFVVKFPSGSWLPAGGVVDKAAPDAPTLPTAAAGPATPGAAPKHHHKH